MPLPTEICDLLRLRLVPGIGPRLTKALIDRFGSAAEVRQANPQELRQVPHIGETLAHSLHRALADLDITPELQLLEKHHTTLLGLGLAGYPPPLSEIPDPPPMLYVRGSWEPRDANAIAIVGSRRCSSYGLRTAERLGSALAHAGFTVVSGLARGIDGIAHRAALQASGRTLAVLAGGLSHIYPPEHVDLALEVEKQGALLSEAPMGMEPLANMFPQRNRIISGLARGVIVVEAAEKSGALLTANHALEHGRPVFAVPGPVDQISSGGTNKLIRNGAILTRGIEDILEELDGIKSAKAPMPTETPADLNPTQQRVWDLLENQTRHVDEIARHLDVAVHELTGHLMMMEMKRAIRRLPGNMYERR